MREVHERNGYIAVRVALDDQPYEESEIYCGIPRCSYKPRVIYRTDGEDKGYCYGCFGQAHPNLREEPIERPIYLYSEWDSKTMERIFDAR